MLEPLLAGAIEKPEELEAMPEELHVGMERLLLNQLEVRVLVRIIWGCTSNVLVLQLAKDTFPTLSPCNSRSQRDSGPFPSTP